MRIRASLALAAALLPALACKPVDPKNPETWVSRLDDADPKKRTQAVQELRKLRVKAAAPLLAALLKDPMIREDVAAALVDLGTPAEAQALIDAIDTAVGAGSDTATRQANRTNAKIADALGAIGDPKAGPALLRLARAKDDLVRISAVQSLGLVRHKEAVPELGRIIDDESTPPILVKKAVVALGQVGDPSALVPLTHALVMERQGVSFISESSFALFLLGDAAVLPLIALLEDKDPAWLAWAKETHRASAGTYAKAALVLGDIGDARAVPALLAKLKYADNDPNPPTARLLTGVVRQFAADALGRLKAKEAAGAIAALVSTKEPADEDLTTFAANALVYLGDRAQAKGLLKAAQAGAIRPRLAAAQAAALLGEGALKKDVEQLSAQAKKGGAKECARTVAELSQQPQADEAGACEKLAASFGLLVPPLAAAEECKEAAACWTQKLAAPEPLVRARAAYELGRAQAVEAVLQLLTLAQDADLTVRLAGIRALEGLLPVAAAREALKAGERPLAERLAAEQGRVQFLKVNEELRRLQAKLKRL